MISRSEDIMSHVMSGIFFWSVLNQNGKKNVSMQQLMRIRTTLGRKYNSNIKQDNTHILYYGKTTLTLDAKIN